MRKSSLTFPILALAMSGCSQLPTNPQANSISNSLPSPSIMPKEFSGDNNDEKRIAYDYVHAIKKIIYANWNVPKNSSNQIAHVIFSLDRTGTIYDININGNNENLNASLLQALQKSSPLPPPPLEYYDTFNKMNFLFHAR